MKKCISTDLDSLYTHHIYSRLFGKPEVSTEPNSDNLCAISMLTSVAGILDAIEHNDPVEIDKCLKGLKSNIESFEKVFYDNLLHERYQKE